MTKCWCHHQIIHQQIRLTVHNFINQVIIVQSHVCKATKHAPMCGARGVERGPWGVGSKSRRAGGERNLLAICHCKQWECERWIVLLLERPYYQKIACDTSSQHNGIQIRANVAFCQFTKTELNCQFCPRDYVTHHTPMDT